MSSEDSEAFASDASYYDEDDDDDCLCFNKQEQVDRQVYIDAKLEMPMRKKIEE